MLNLLVPVVVVSLLKSQALPLGSLMGGSCFLPELALSAGLESLRDRHILLDKVEVEAWRVAEAAGAGLRDKMVAPFELVEHGLILSEFGEELSGGVLNDTAPRQFRD